MTSQNGNRGSGAAARKQAEICAGLVSELDSAVANGAAADKTLAACFRRHREWGGRDRRFFSETVFSWFRWRGWLTKTAPADSRALCALASLMDSSEVHPAVRFLASEGALPCAEPLPLAGLEIGEKAAALSAMAGLPSRPALNELAPLWLNERLDAPEGMDRAENFTRCIEAFQSRPPAWLRAAPGSGLELELKLAGYGITCSAHSGMPEAIRVAPRSDLALFRKKVSNAFEVQDLASQLVGLLAAPLPGQAWWDACAGTGGKALHLAELMGNRGRVFATDARPHVLRELTRRAAERGIRGIRAAAWNGLSDPAPAPAPDFDGVILDAPCSGLGLWHRNPDARWRTSPDDIARSADIQGRLLDACACAVKPGGRMVYATCTLTSVENREAVLAFLDRRKDFRPAPVVNPLDRAAPPGFVMVMPWQAGCNGMFVAVLEKACNTTRLA